MNEQIYDSYSPYLNTCQDIYDKAIHSNLENRLKSPEYVKCLSLHEYRRNFATVSINLGRRTGKTYYINYKNNYNKDIVLVTHSPFHRYADYDHCVNIIHMSNDLRFPVLAGLNLREHEFIWVDDSSDINPRLLEEVLFHLYTKKSQTVIMLG